MIYLILKDQYSSKNKVIIITYLILLITIFIIFLPFDYNLIELYINQNQLMNMYHELVFELLKLILPIFLLLLVSDHDKRYLNNLSTYFNRFKVINIKLFLYLYLNIINILIIILLYLLIPKIFNYHFLINITLLKKEIISIFIDLIILTLLILLFSRNYNQIYSYLIIAVYIVLNFVYAFYTNIFIYYFIPFYSNYYQKYLLTTKYQIIYITLLIIINYYRYLNEDFK